MYYVPEVYFVMLGKSSGDFLRQLMQRISATSSDS